MTWAALMLYALPAVERDLGLEPPSIKTQRDEPTRFETPVGAEAPSTFGVNFTAIDKGSAGASNRG